MNMTKRLVVLGAAVAVMSPLLSRYASAQGMGATMRLRNLHTAAIRSGWRRPQNPLAWQGNLVAARQWLNTALSDLRMGMPPAAPEHAVNRALDDLWQAPGDFGGQRTMATTTLLHARHILYVQPYRRALVASLIRQAVVHINAGLRWYADYGGE